MRIVILVVVVCLAACSANDDVPAPRVAGINPDHAPVGGFVVVTGDYFCAQPEDEERDPLACDVVGVVSFGAATALSAEYSDMSIHVEVPDAGLGSITVSVTVAGRFSNRVGFTID